MLKLEHTEVVGWEAAIHGMRNPDRSWEKSDSLRCRDMECNLCPMCTDAGFLCGDIDGDFVIGNQDRERMMRLKSGAVGTKYRQMITVYADITAPVYWWEDFHIIAPTAVVLPCTLESSVREKEFTLEDFSHEHLIDYDLYSCDEVDRPVLEYAPHINCGGVQHMHFTINMLNYYRQKYLETDSEINKCHFNELEKRKKLVAAKTRYWKQMALLLPDSYNQLRTVKLDYEILSDIYHAKRCNDLDEWKEFCGWIDGLPYSELIVGRKFITGISESEKILRLGKLAHESFEKGMEADWKKANPGVYPEEGEKFGVLDAITLDKETGAIRTHPDFSSDEDEWPSMPEGVKNVLIEWNEAAGKMRLEGIKSVGDLKKGLGIVSPSTHEEV